VEYVAQKPIAKSIRKRESGLHDYWLNLIAEKSLSPVTRITGNAG
jgi:hypothetical protein